MLKSTLSNIILPRLSRSIIVLFLITIITATLSPISAYGANLDELQSQKDAAQQRANELKSQATQKQHSINTISDLIDKLTSDIASYQRQINTTQRNITANEKSIAATELQIQQKQAELEMNMARQTDAIQTMYVVGRQSTLETLIASSSLSEAVARQQYLTALSEKIEALMQETKRLKDELEAKRTSLEKRRIELSVQKSQIAALQATIISQKKQQSVLLSGAIAEKQQILADAKTAEKQVQHISAIIYAERQRLIASGDETVLSGDDGGYPLLRSYGPGAADPWGFYVGQCTSYVAWYWNVVLGRKWSRLAGYGDAWGWSTAAPSNGVSTHTAPQINAIISWNRSSTAPWGHVAIVRKVNNDGTIDISEYNYIAPNAYSYRANVTPAAYGSYKYIY